MGQFFSTLARTRNPTTKCLFGASASPELWGSPALWFLIVAGKNPENTNWLRTDWTQQNRWARSGEGEGSEPWVGLWNDCFPRFLLLPVVMVSHWSPPGPKMWSNFGEWVSTKTLSWASSGRSKAAVRLSFWTTWSLWMLHCVVVCAQLLLETSLCVLTWVNVVHSYDYVLEPSPVALPLEGPQQTRVLQVSCGRAHSLVLTDQEGGENKGSEFKPHKPAPF